jgi:hypothetical protein
VGEADGSVGVVQGLPVLRGAVAMEDENGRAWRDKPPFTMKL